MDVRRNELGQPIGDPVDLDLPLDLPWRETMQGEWCSLVALDPRRHGAELHAAFAAESDAADWTYLPYGPFPSAESFTEWLVENASADDPLFFVIEDRDGPCGMASYLRITPWAASIEVGHVHFAPRLQRTAAATEAMWLMMRRAFDGGCRRYEWKCDDLNARSMAAAERLGFRPEGVFRQATIYKGRNRDSAWFSIIDTEWPEVDHALSRWLDPSNFDADGVQRSPLKFPDA